jgi:metal-sulfur cluster biosynthetic enzyme
VKILDNGDGVEEATVDLVWDPLWDPNRISEEARQKLGIG